MMLSHDAISCHDISIDHCQYIKNLHRLNQLPRRSDIHILEWKLRGKENIIPSRVSSANVHTIDVSTRSAIENVCVAQLLQMPIDWLQILPLFPRLRVFNFR